MAAQSLVYSEWAAQCIQTVTKTKKSWLFAPTITETYSTFEGAACQEGRAAACRYCVCCKGCSCDLSVSTVAALVGGVSLATIAVARLGWPYETDDEEEDDARAPPTLISPPPRA